MRAAGAGVDPPSDPGPPPVSPAPADTMKVEFCSMALLTPPLGIVNITLPVGPLELRPLPAVMLLTTLAGAHWPLLNTSTCPLAAPVAVSVTPCSLAILVAVAAPVTSPAKLIPEAGKL